MEHRHYPRNKESFRLTISNPRYGTAEAEVHDISHEGIAVRLDDMPFPQGTLVELTLPEAQQQRYNYHGDIRGYVVHAKEGEAGLWLFEPKQLF